jgi:large subunit ribosomal protein L4
MKLNVIDLQGVSCGEIEVSERAFGRDVSDDLVHQVVTAYMSAARSGSRAQKNRSDVRGGGRKPWKQKGSGRARAGSSRSPIWRSGGVTFAARPQDHSQKVNRKMYRAAIAGILSELHSSGRLLIVENIILEQPKTKILKEKIAKYLDGSVLIVLSEVTKNLHLSARNLPDVDVRDISSADPVSLVGYDKVIITVEAVKKMEAALI